MATLAMFGMVVVIAGAGPVYRAFRRRRVLRAPHGEAPRPSTAARAWLASARRSAFTIHADRFTLASRASRRMSCTATGLEVHEGSTCRVLRWDDHVLPGPVPLARGWFVAWSPGGRYDRPKVTAWFAADASSTSGRGARDHVSIQTFLSRSEWEVLLALPRVLRARPELRAALDDAATVTRLANEIAQWRPALQPHELGGMRRGTIEVQTAMRSLGYVHALGRPLPGDHLPGLDDTVTATRRALDANPYARPELVDEDELRHIVRRDFLDIEPFPFVALVEFAHGRT